MAIDKPYYRTVRPFTDNDYTERGRAAYITDPDFSKNAANYIQAFLLLQKDILELFEYVEPSRLAKDAYSHRIYELFLRVCTEVENNFRAIFDANSYPEPNEHWDIDDYRKINKSHFLAKYEVTLLPWEFTASRRPFQIWDDDTVTPSGNFRPLKWYQAYNKVKHDRDRNFNCANLENLVSAFCGLSAIIAAQYFTYDFMTIDRQQAPDLTSTIATIAGNYVIVKFPIDIPVNEKYDYEAMISDSGISFQRFDYDAI